jgi:hypothetical protein
MLDSPEYIPEEQLNFPPGSVTMVSGVETSAAAPMEEIIDNIKENLKLKLPIFENMLEYGKLKGDKPIALVGGGPSLKKPSILQELRTFKTIIACGSVHDYITQRDIIPTYATNCDPSPISAGYYKHPDSETKYLMASSSDKKTMEALKGQQVVLWHCHSEEIQKEVLELAPDVPYQAVCGGCTVGLRSISIAIMLGYSNLHFFGFDSCMSEDGVEHHAYNWANPEEENNLIPKVHKIQLGPKEGPNKNSKYYYVAGYQLAQLYNFKDFYVNFSQYFKPTFHGGGALSDFYDLMVKPKEQ